MPHTRRETAGVTTRLIVAFVRTRAGDEGVAQLLTLADVPHTLEQLEDERFWCSYDDKIALLRAACDVLDDPRVARSIGESLLSGQVGVALRLLIGSLGSPQQVLRSVAKAHAKFSTSATMAAEETSPRGGVVTYHLHRPNVPSRLDCDYTQGVLSQVSVLFGLPPADITHPVCQVDGATMCRYVVTWAPRRLRDRLPFTAAARPSPFEADALRERLADLQSTVADLVSTPDLDELLPRIADRAGASVRGQRYLLAVQLTGEPAPRIHASGFAPAEAARLGTALLADRAGGSEVARITAEVRSTQRRYGWLAAELPPGQGFLPTEQQQFDAFGRLAAAAIDAATALEEARRRGATAEALLRLGHELGREEDEVGIAQRICAATPVVLGVDRSFVLLWDADARAFRTAATHGFAADDPVHAYVFAHHDRTDQLAEMTVDPGQRWFTGDDVAPGGITPNGWHAEVIATAPIAVRGRVAAILVALWDLGRTPAGARERVLRELAALGDQATTAFIATRALGEARYRASHDALTGLANRVLFGERIVQALADGRRTGTPPIVCFIDLDGFKGVNDAHGHAVGDQLLIEVGRRIVTSVRETDAVARLSGDEFGVLLRGIAELAAAELVAHKLVTVLGEPFDIDGRELRIGASIGVAVATEADTSPDRLLNAADDAMYRAKVERGTYRVAAR